MTPKRLRELRDELAENYGNNTALLEPAETYDPAIIGVTATGVFVYSWSKLVEQVTATMKDSKEPELDAIEWLEYNTLRSLPYMGDGAPVIMYDLEGYE